MKACDARLTIGGTEYTIYDCEYDIHDPVVPPLDESVLRGVTYHAFGIVKVPTNSRFTKMLLHYFKGVERAIHNGDLDRWESEGGAL